jgi:dCTP deaminase
MRDLTEPVEVAEGDPFILHPGEFVLGSTLERVGIPDDMVARLEGKSSLGRLGLLIHSTAGYVDPGWAASSRSSSRTWRTCPSRSTRG